MAGAPHGGAGGAGGGTARLGGLGDRFIIPIGLTGLAGLAAKTGKHRMALRLAGAAEAYRDAYESAFPEPNRAYRDSWLAPSFKAAGAAAARLLAEGRQ